MSGPGTPQNLVELWEHAVAWRGPAPLFGTRGADGAWHWMSYAEAGARVDALRAGLHAAGVGPGDAVGFIGNNRPEWAIAAFATHGLKARFVPMYEAELRSVWRYILADAGVKIVLVSSRKVADVLGDLSDLPAPPRVVVIEGDGDDTLQALEAAGRAAPVPSQRPEPGDVATLIYTSGTTGEPKGVLLTHRNFTSNVLAGHALFPDICADDRALSILPWAHVYAETGELFLAVHCGASIAIAGGPATIAADIREVRPTLLVCVPRVFNRIHDNIRSTVAAAGGLKARLFQAALDAARRKRETGRAGLRWRVLDRIVFGKIRAQLGGRLKRSLSGSAKMNPDILRFFGDVGIDVYDCYGLTETSPAVTMNCPAANKVGTVGRPVPGVTVRIDPAGCDDGSGEGEILVFGPNVMAGYHGKPEATAAVMTADGGFRTGDRGRLDEDGFLHVTGRFKEQYKLANGKYVFPATIEEEIKLIPYVLNAMVYGDGREANECIVVPDLARLRHSARELGLSVDPEVLFREDLEAGRAVRDLVGLDIANHLRGKFASYEIPRRFHFVLEDFTVANGLLTQTLKLKRRAVLERFAGITAAAAEAVPPG